MVELIGLGLMMVIFGILIVAACMRSSQITRDEEER